MLAQRIQELGEGLDGPWAIGLDHHGPTDDRTNVLIWEEDSPEIIRRVTFQQNPPRSARLVLVTPDGEVIGALPPLRVETPWWQDAEPVVRAAREHYHIDVTILRLLETELTVPHGGAVSYLAEMTGSVASEVWNGTLDDHPLRMPWARPGGPAADVAWAEMVLAEHRVRRVGPPEQVRSWNLSSLWRLPVEGQTVWLKCVPPFFAHEGRILRATRGLARAGPHLARWAASLDGRDPRR